MSNSYNHELLWQKNQNKSIHLTITRAQIKTITIQITKIVVMAKINNSFNKNIRKYKGRKMMRMKWIWRKVRMFRMEKHRYKEKEKMEIKSSRIRISRRWRSRIWEICSMIRTCNKNNNQFKTNLMKIMTYLKYLGPYHQIWYTENQKPKGKKGN